MAFPSGVAVAGVPVPGPGPSAASESFAMFIPRVMWLTDWLEYVPPSVSGGISRRDMYPDRVLGPSWLPVEAGPRTYPPTHPDCGSCCSTGAEAIVGWRAVMV